MICYILHLFRACSILHLEIIFMVSHCNKMFFLCSLNCSRNGIVNCGLSRFHLYLVHISKKSRHNYVKDLGNSIPSPFNVS